MGVTCQMAIKQEQDLPSLHRAIWLKAVSALQLGNLGYTIQLMRTLLKEHPDFLQGRQLLRQAAISMPCRGPNVFQKIHYLLSLTKAWIKGRKKTSLAFEEIENLLEYDPYNRHANWLLYQIASACNFPETAAFALEILLEGHPKDVPAMHKLSEYYIQQEQPQRAVEIYKRILAVMPGDLVAIRASKDAAAQASMQSGGWNREGVTYRNLIRKTNEVS